MSLLRWPSYYERLANDIEVIIWPTDSRHINLFFIFETGQQHFPARYAGLSHFVEHLMFQGTQNLGSTDYNKIEKHIQKMHDKLNKINHTKDIKEIIKIRNDVFKMEKQISEYITHNDFVRLLTSMGASYVNASTYAQSVKYEVVLWHKDNLLDVLNLFYNQFIAPVFYTFVTEQNIILHEMVMSEDHRLLRVYSETLKNSYLEHPIIGYKSSIISITPRIAYDYVKTYYQPRNLIILLAGNTDYSDIELIKQVFEPMTNSFTFYFPNFAPISPVPRRDKLVFKHPKESRFFSNLKVLKNIKEKTIAMLINNYLGTIVNSNTYHINEINTYLFEEQFVIITETIRDVEYKDVQNDVINILSPETTELIKNTYYDMVQKAQRNSSEMLDLISDVYMHMGAKSLRKIKKIDEIVQDLTYNDFYLFLEDLLSHNSLCQIDFLDKKGLFDATLEQNNLAIDIDEPDNRENYSQISPKVLKICAQYESKYKPQKIEDYMYSTEIYKKYKDNIYVFNKEFEKLLASEKFVVLIFDKKGIDLYEENVLYNVIKIAKNKLNSKKVRVDLWSMYDNLVIVIQGYKEQHVLEAVLLLMMAVEETGRDENAISHICKIMRTDLNGIDDLEVKNVSNYNERNLIFTMSNMLFYENYDKIKIKSSNLEKCFTREYVSRIMRAVLSNAVLYYHGPTDLIVKEEIDKIANFLLQYSKYNNKKRIVISKIDKSKSHLIKGKNISHEVSILRVYPLGKLKQKEIQAIDTFVHYTLSISYPSLYNLIRTTHGLSYMVVANYYIIDHQVFFLIEFGLSKENIAQGESILNKALSKCIKEMKNHLGDFIQKQGTLNTYSDTIIYEPIHCLNHYKAVSNGMDRITFHYDLVLQDPNYVISFVEDKIYKGNYIHLVFDL